MGKSIIIGGRVILPSGVRSDVSVLFADGKITGILPAGQIPEDCNVIDATGKYVSPGFVDIHIHGGGGCDFMDGTVEAFLEIARIHATHGTTALSPTTLTCPDEELFALFDILKESRARNENGAELLGMHLEGPYFSPAKAGAQDPKYLIAPRPEHYNKIYDAGDGNIIRWSIAPELDGAMEFCRTMTARGVIVSQAHSDCIYEQAVQAYEAGARLSTHMYCAMSTITRDKGFRHGGLIEASYLLDDMDIEIIADGCHLPKELLQFVMKFKGSDRTALCTDAMRAAGMPGDRSILGSLTNGQTVLIEDGVAKLMDRSAFAGSVCTTDRLVRTMVNLAGVSVPDAVKMASTVPSRILGIDSRKGSLQSGKDADIVIFDDSINISRTIVCGKTVYCK